MTDAPGVRDYIEHGVTGLIVPPTAAELGAAVERALVEHDSPFFVAMVERARERVLTSFTPIHYRRRLLQQAEDILGC